MSRHTFQARRAFTLVEVLIAIAIIGILMGLALTGINAARVAIQRRAIALEVETLSQAVESYKLKYSSYPPDGSSLAAFRSHFQGAFPSIASSEFDVLTAAAGYRLASKGSSNTVASDNHGGVMDPAEALVFCLGGFSNDPAHPFTGKGGPLVEIKNSSGAPFSPRRFQYNVDRNEPFFPFDQSNLTLQNVTGEHDGLVTVSSDEDTGGFGTGAVDALPVYIPKNRTLPIVYFSGSTYDSSFYSGTAIQGGAKPYRSEKVNTSVNYSPTTASRYYTYMNAKSFQVLSAGLDDQFGDNLLNTATVAPYFTYPSGYLINVLNGNSELSNPSGTQYQSSPGAISGHRDNVTNFSEGALEDALP